MDNSFSSPSETANPINAVALPIFCIIAILITYLPFRSFKRLRNFPACNIIIVSDIVNIFSGLNAIIWPNDDWSTWWPGYGLCDVEAILKFPLTLGLATSLCRLTQDIASALDVDNAQFNTTAGMKRRKLVLDVVFCWGPPLFEICLHYTVQNGRYAVAPVFGCGDQLDNSWPVILIYSMWIPLIMILNLYYAGKFPSLLDMV
jgi:pheromone a factor receptor